MLKEGLWRNYLTGLPRLENTGGSTHPLFIHSVVECLPVTIISLHIFKLFVLRSLQFSGRDKFGNKLISLLVYNVNNISWEHSLKIHKGKTELHHLGGLLPSLMK